jgi:hypothetical protein
VIAHLTVAAECGCAAHLNIGHDAPLLRRHGFAVLASIVGAVAAKYVRQFWAMIMTRRSSRLTGG